MSKTEMIRARIEPELKHEVEKILSELGLNPTTAINIFYHQVKLQKGLPFDVSIPNKTTIQTFKDIILIGSKSPRTSTFSSY